MLLRLARTFLLLFVVVVSSSVRAMGQNPNVPDFQVTSLPQDVGFDAGPQSIVLADVNNDGRDDLIAINRLNENTKVLIRLAGEDGMFQDPPTEVDVFLEEESMVPVALAIGDVGSPFIGPQEGNADGNPDIVVATEDGYVVVLTGDGQGGFEVREESIDLLIEGRGVSLADVDDDGDIDIAAIDEDTLYIFLNEGFAFNVDDAEEYDLDNEVDAIDVATGDFDDDGDVDVIALNPEDRTISVLFGDGTGLFTDAALKISTVVDPNDADQTPSDFAVADLDGDSIDDVVVINFGDFGDRQVLVSTGALQNRTGLSGPFEGTGVALANFDDDEGGTIDAVLLSESEGAAFLVGNESSSGFPDLPPIRIGGAGSGRVMAAGDIDGDDRPDFVALNNSGDQLEVAINQGVATPTPTPTPTATPTVRDPTPTPTATTPSSTFTPTRTSTPVPTSTVPPTSTPTETSPVPTSTPPRIINVDDGCAVTTARAGSIPAVWIVPVAALLWRRRR